MITSIPLVAQRSYIELGLTTDLSDRLSLTVTPEWRSDPNDDEEQFHTDFSLDYEITQHWDIGLGYRVGQVFPQDEDSIDFHRYLIETKYGWKFDDFSFQIRVRYLNGSDDDEEDEENLRYRFKFTYDWDRFSLKPFVAAELQETIHTDKDKVRNAYSTGISWDFIKDHNITGEYQWIDKLHSRKDYGVIKFSYGYEF